MNEHEKKIAYVIGGLAVIALLWWASRRGMVLTGQAAVTDGSDPVAYDNSVPGYTTQNQPSPPASTPSTIYNQTILEGSTYGAPQGSTFIIGGPDSGQSNCGCSSTNDGCFTSSVLNGNAPASLNQLLYNNSGSAALIAAIASTVDAYEPTFIVVQQAQETQPVRGHYGFQSPFYYGIRNINIAPSLY